MTAQEILHEANMSSRPEYYSGRGAVTCDLNYTLLTKIAGLIETHQGPDAKAAFVEMVAAMKRATATDFIHSLYRLERNGWKFDAPVDLKGIDVGPDNEGRYAVGMATIFEVLGGSNDRDETTTIRNQFLSENRIEVKGCAHWRTEGEDIEEV